MKKTLFASAMVLALTACNTQPQASNAASGTSANVAGLETESKQLSYFLGYEFAQNVPLEQLKNIKIELDNQLKLKEFLKYSIYSEQSDQSTIKNFMIVHLISELKYDQVSSCN